MAKIRPVPFALLAVAGVAVGAGVVALRPNPNTTPGIPTSTSKFLAPLGEHVDVGSFPIEMVASPDGRYLVVTTTGFRQQLSVLDAVTGKLVSRTFSNERGEGAREALYFGLTFAPDGTLYASRGNMDLVTAFRLDASGNLTKVRDLANPGPEMPAGFPRIPHYVAGVALSPDGETLIAVNNQTHVANGMRGSVSFLDVKSGELRGKAVVGGFPFAVVAPKVGPGAGKAYVANERDGNITVLGIASREVERVIRVGARPSYLRLNSDQTRLYVSNAGSESISEIDLATNRVARTLMVHPAELRGLAGMTPLGTALSADEKTMFVALADLNAVAVLDLVEGKLQGLLPAGWYPTAVYAAPDGKSLFVSNAKGVISQIQNKNLRFTGDRRFANQVEGTVARIELGPALQNLRRHSEEVLTLNRGGAAEEERTRLAFRNPGIKHVIYVIKENRTYDQVLGQLPQGNGDPSLTLFPREVTPNQHALAERFVLLDNFHVAGEVSADGWNWTTAGMASPYVQRNTFTNYSGRGRNYDFEGLSNGVAMEPRGQTDVAEPTSGYIWDTMLKAGVTVRNYGAFLTFANAALERLPDNEGGRWVTENAPTKKALEGISSAEFRRYDMTYPDSEAWIKHGVQPAPNQMLKFGPKDDPSRMTAWLREFKGFVEAGKMPQFQIVRLGRNHTSGTTAGAPSPRACVADNDYAVGQLVEAISNSPFWNSTAIFILEDDAQAGTDHVDAHRSTAFVISPFIRRGRVDSRFFNTDSMLRTMELLLGAKPMNHYDALAPVMTVFENRVVNPEPYQALLPAKEIIGEVNQRTAYRSADSARLLSHYHEEDDSAIELNDILWGAIKGADTPRPKTPGACWPAGK